LKVVDKQDTAFAYTLSSRKKMVQQCLRSIATLKQHADSAQIKIYYTPPYNEEDEEALRATGAEIVKKENQTEAFNVSRSLPESHYGEKINLCNIDAENVVFLDCDTIVGNNIWDVLEGEFDFKARPEVYFTEEEDKDWYELFEERDEEPHSWMPNAGFLIFKNGFHKEIKEKWTKYTKQDLDFQIGKVQHDEQYALALAVSGENIEKMDEKDHVFEYKDEKTADAYVYHVDHAAGSNMINLVKNYVKRLKAW
jgi:hypothetical protein